MLQAVIAVVVLCVLIAAAFYLVSRFRDYAANDWQEPDSDLAKFEEMRRRGDISEAEYRMIQLKSTGDSTARPSDDQAAVAESSSGPGGASRNDEPDR